MKLALLSDIHANQQALQACLDHAQDQGAQRVALLGDLVGYGGNPTQVMEQVMGLAAEGAIVLQGNHDEMAVQPPTDKTTLGTSTADWTHAQLSPEHRSFLAGVPLTTQVQHLMLVHASADQPAKWRYVDSEQAAHACLLAAQSQHPETQHVLVGHVHQQTLYHRSAGRGLMAFKPTPGVAIPMPRTRPCVVTIGSVGQPRDGDPRAMYALYDLSAERLTFHRVPYDHVAAAAAIRAAGLPEFFALRLETGQ